MVERVEFRSRGARAVGRLASYMTNRDYGLFVRWLLAFSRHAKMVHRLFSVDVAMALLEQPERRPEEGEEPGLACFLQQRFLVQQLLFARRTDESPTVQGHALACLAQCLELPSLNVTQAVHGLFSATGTHTLMDDVTAETLSSQNSLKTYGSLPFRTVELSGSDVSADDAKENVALLLRRVGDSKANVRKSALQALVGLLKHGVIPMSRENLETVSERCRDPAASVKKKALQCVGELLAARPALGAVRRAWLRGVLPAVVDSESVVQDRALEALEQVLLSQVKRRPAGGGGGVLDGGQRLAWDLLLLLCDECQNLSRYLSRAVVVWSKQNRLTQTLVDDLMSHTEAEHAAAAWMLLSKVAASAPQLPCGRIVEAWDAVASCQDVKAATCCHILSVLGDVAQRLSDDDKQRIVADLMSWLKAFSLSLELISAAVETLHLLGRSQDVRRTQDFLDQHCGQLLSACETHLAEILLREDGTQDLDQELMIRHLHTLGVASLQSPGRVGGRLVLLVESVLTTRGERPAGREAPPLPRLRADSLPPRVRAHGVITLGKLCLQQEELVQRYLPVLARELEEGAEAAVRNNVVVLMCDLCVRYTSAVDRYVPNISACLRDGQAVVREQTLVMLTNLLQEEFVKWKGSLFFRFVVTLVDPVPDIARLSEYCLLHLLLKKNPELFSQHFIECIFHFNCYSRHQTYNRFPQSQREKIRFSLKGSAFSEKRFWIYRFLLRHCTDAQRLGICSRINHTVLACFADEELPLDADGAEILSETFKILSLKELELQSGCSPAGGAAAADLQSGCSPAGGAAAADLQDDDMPSMAKAVLQAAHKKVVSQVQRRAFTQNTVPLVISLKSLLEQRRSPVLRELMAYLQETMRDRRHQVKDVFSGDQQLAAELEFALRTAETEGQTESVGLASPPPPPQGGRRSPPPPQASVQASPSRRRPLSSFSFTTPQPPQPEATPPRAPLSHRAASRKAEEGAELSRSVSLEGTVVTRAAAAKRAISTPKGSSFNLTFEEGLSAIFSTEGSSDVNMSSNQPQTPVFRRWNVQSPLRKRSKPSRV